MPLPLITVSTLTAPLSINLPLVANATFDQTIQFNDANGVPVNVSGWITRMQGRTTTRGSGHSPLLEVTDGVPTPNIGIVGSVVNGGSLGTIQLLIPGTQTQNAAFEQCYFDTVTISGSGYSYRLIEGTLTTDPNATFI